jgi:hypothetical protein
MPLIDYTYVVSSMKPSPEGSYWAFVDARSKDEALLDAAPQLPQPYGAFKVPTQRLKTFVNAAIDFAPVWMVGTFLIIGFLTFNYRRSAAGFVVMSWPQAFGSALLLFITVLTTAVAYCAILDFLCARDCFGALKTRATVASDGSVLEPQSVTDVLYAFGSDRVGETTRRFNKSFAIALLVIVVVGSISRFF